MPEAFHALDHYEVWADEDGQDRRPRNLLARKMIGMDAEDNAPCGPVMLTPLPDGQDNRAERAHQCRFFGT